MKRILLSFFLLVAALVFAACSVEPADLSAGGNVPRGTPVRGGAIVVGIAQDLDASLDPHGMLAGGTAGTREVLFNLFEGLMRPTADGEMTPAVAESVTVDGTVYTFTLREGIRFHNGKFVTVEDIVYSIDRTRDPENVTTHARGLHVITRVETIDDRTVEIEIEEPDNEFLPSLTVAIIPQGYDNQARHPIGTGPFRFVSYSPQEYLTMARFDDYWGKPAYLDEITFRVFSGGEALALALQAEAVDIAARLTVDQIRALPPSFYYLEGTMNLVQALYLNNAVPPLDNLLVRQALNYAVNVQEIMDILADGMGHPLGSSIYPGLVRYFYAELADAYPHSPARAIELLTEAGVADGFDLRITVPGNFTPHVITAEVIVEQLRAVGIRAEIDLVEWTHWLSEVNSGRNFEATVIGLDAHSLTARAMLDRFVSDSSRNFMNFNSPVFDETFAAARAATDLDEQIALYRELQAILSREAAAVYLQDMANLVAVRQKLAGWQFYPLYVMPLATVHFVE